MMANAIRRHLFLSPDGVDGNGAGDPPKNQDPPQDGDTEDDEDDEAVIALKAAGNEKGLKALRSERAARRASDARARDAEAWRVEREKKDQEAADEDARKRGDLEAIATREKQRAEKAEAERDAEREARRRERVESAIAREAIVLSFHDADDAVSRIELSRVEFGDDGKPKNIKKLVKDLADAKPYLIKPGGDKEGIPASGKPGDGRPLTDKQREEAQRQQAGFSQRTF
jgi:hypothetical protein